MWRLSVTILKHDPDEGCAECPFAMRSIEECAADETRRVATCEDEPAPDDCPLRGSPVTVAAPQPHDGEIVRLVVESSGWCSVCFDAQTPCYCDPSYDE